MRGQLIKLFMWGYQPHFRVDVELSMNAVMKELGVSEAGAECLLVGARIPCHENPNDVCVEPEEGKWPINLFDGLLEAIETEFASHPMQKIFYDDRPSMEEKPENIRKDSVRRAVQQALTSYDLDHGVHSFAGAPAPVGDYYVVPVLQLPGTLFQQFPPLHKPISDDGRFTGHESLIHAAIAEVLVEACNELVQPEPGRNLRRRWASAEELVRRAAASFMYTPGIVIGDKMFFAFDLFEQINLMSSLMYEGTRGTGRLLLAQPDSVAVNMSLRFATPVPFREPGWARKVLELATGSTALIADCAKIFGLGDVATDHNPGESQDVFVIEFLDHYHWRLLCGDKTLLISEYGRPSLPQAVLSRVLLLDTYQRLFPTANMEDFECFWELCQAAVEQHHGSMLVVTEDAECEAARLQSQGTQIESKKLTPTLYRQVSGIDGAVIVDPYSNCYAIGVILDGLAHPACTPSRGARYNSGIRYVHAADAQCLAVVVSADQTVNVIPEMRLRVQRSAIVTAIATLETATADNYHEAIRWLDRHRFYLSQEQCDQVNAALERIQNEPMDVGELRIQWSKFSLHPDLDESFFLHEGTGSNSV
ncbi:MAG: hypothetical protein F4Y08_03195 [Caldilineaceae bacterium SB0662_bin_9]|uniref:DAC domain-containing protein n=1 Tax=Caldilineaceae bacterium SB0662_bin_9 TaxID=2605258 RepID=A0A6B1DSG9_9CHLR|nr:hypothetical protein [Caldilineaceae bacterium SB0662_bin_9]